MENQKKTLQIAGREFEIEIAHELCGSIPERGHLYQLVCVSCREQNARGRDEWVSKATFLDSTDPDMVERFQAALDELAEHVHMHEVIGEWAAKVLLPANMQPTPDRVDTLEWPRP